MSAVLNKIENILTSEYSVGNYVEFIREIFDSLSFVDPNNFRGEFSNFSTHIKGSAHIGNYTSPDKKKIAIFAVELKKENYVESSRSTQRSYAKKLIESGNCDAAIVAFYTAGESKWRLSFVRLDYEMKIEKGKLKTTENITPAKRYSFLVGRDEPCHTAIERFRQFIIDRNSNPTLDELEEAFSVERVTKEFFELYCEKFYQLQEFLDSNDDFVEESKRCGFTSEQYAKKLMGQIVFLYFLQKKGWLGVNVWPSVLTEKEYNNVFYVSGAQGRIIKDSLPKIYIQQPDGTYRLNSKALDSIADSDEEVIANYMPRKKTWGDGSRKFLRTIFEFSKNHKGNFFENYLEPLFYSTLNRNRGPMGYCPELHCRIPFLSGGLFEPLDGYDWKSNVFDIPDEIFSNKKDANDRNANGILDIFDRYNFTISEDEPMEREVAVDPEMLGKIFENLLEVKDRKSKGAFYTPREIVHYMCQESLINYLVRKTSLPEEAIRDFILFGDFMKGEDTDKSKRLGNGGMFISPQLFKVNETGEVIVNKLKDIDDALASVRVADPAVGSGAFPLGMVNEIVRARENITAYISIGMNANAKRLMYKNERSPYALKLNTIRNSIFAVDIEPSAIDITQLRLWLSLVIDDEITLDASNDLEGHKNPLPLPNLECNILCGNSLIDEFKGVKLVKESDILGTMTAGVQMDFGHSGFETVVKQLLKLQDELFICDEPHKKFELKGKIQGLKDMIISEQLAGCTEETKLEYSFAVRRPSKPFVLWNLDFARVFRDNGGFDIVIGNPPYGAKLSDAEKNLFKTKYNDVHMRTPDTYNYFISMSARMIAPKGVLCFIVPNTLLFQNEYEKTRTFLTDSKHLKCVINIGDNVFEKAEVPTCIFLAEMAACNVDYQIKYADFREVPNKEIHWGSYNETIDYNTLLETPGRVLGVNQSGSNILKKVKAQSVTIDEVAEEMAAGISSGGNDVFCITQDMATENNFEPDILRPLLTGKIIDRYKTSWKGELIIYSTKWSNTPKYKNIFSYMQPHEERLSKKRETQKGMIPWYSLHWPRTPELFAGKKIVMRQTSDCIRATIDNDGFYVLNTLLVLRLKEGISYSYEFVLAVLNSKLNNYVYRSLTQEKGRTFAEVKPKNVRKLYLPKISSNEQDKFVSIVSSILSGEIDREEGMKQIDLMLYDVYALTDKEIVMIESEV